MATTEIERRKQPHVLKQDGCKRTEIVYDFIHFLRIFLIFLFYLDISHDKIDMQAAPLPSYT